MTKQEFVLSVFPDLTGTEAEVVSRFVIGKGENMTFKNQLLGKGIDVNGKELTLEEVCKSLCINSAKTGIL